jgi:hypothetical protein
MSRNAAAVGALVLVGGLLWIVTAWPTPEDDRPDPLEPEAPVAQPSPEPAAVPAAPAIGTPPKQPERLAEKPPDPPVQPQPAAPQPPPYAREEDMFAKEQGPVAEYKHLYETEPRNSAANETESALRGAFVAADGAPDLFKSVLCRQTVCKLDLRWSNERMGAYIAGMTRVAASGFSATVAVAPGGPIGDDKVRPIEVYIKRKPTTSSEQSPPPQPAAAQAPALPAAPGQPSAAEPPPTAPVQPTAPPASSTPTTPTAPAPPAH